MKHALIRALLASVLSLWLTTSAWAGFDEGLAAYERGDYGSAFHQWLALARADDPRAQKHLGALYENGWGVTQNGCKAERWYRRAETGWSAAEASADKDSECQNGKATPIAQSVYLEAYTNMVFRKSAQAVKPLTHLVAADPDLADVQNALAIALFVARPEVHAIAFQHATEALALAPHVPQFIVTHVLTDRSQWRIEDNGTARLTHDAAQRLIGVRSRLLDMPGNAKKLGKVLRSIEEIGGNPAFPFVFAKYKKLLKRPSLTLTLPAREDFDIAQKVIFALWEKNKEVIFELEREHARGHERFRELAEKQWQAQHRRSPADAPWSP